MNTDDSPVSCTKYRKWSLDTQLVLTNTQSHQQQTNQNEPPAIKSRNGNGLSIYTLQAFEPNPINPSKEIKIKVYKRRFWMMFLYSVCVLMNQMQFLQYTAIADVVRCYYGVDAIAINATALVFLVTFVLMSFPATYFLDKFGMRTTVLLTSVINVTSTAIQCGAQNPKRFYVVIIGQTVASFAQVLCLALSPRMAAIWFGPSEVSRATSISLCGGQFGIALGYLFSTYATPLDCKEIAMVEKGRSTMAFSLLAMNIVVFLLILTTFQNCPKLPPSPAEASKSSKKANYKANLIALAKNRNFLALLFSFSLENGFFLGLSTVLSEILFLYYQDPQSQAVFPWIGFVIVFSGLFGVICSGYVMDSTHRYKHAAVFLTIGSTLAFLGFSIMLYYGLIAVQMVTIALIGCFQCGYIGVSLEFGSELTYPVEEGIMSGIMNASGMLGGVILSFSGTVLLQNYSALAANLLFFTVLVVTCFTNALLVKQDLRRTEENEKQLKQEN